MLRNSGRSLTCLSFTVLFSSSHHITAYILLLPFAFTALTVHSFPLPIFFFVTCSQQESRRTNKKQAVSCCLLPPYSLQFDKNKKKKMTSSAADRFVGAGTGAGEGGGGEEQLLLHHPQMYYHVPQHSRREKLRFPTEEPPQPPAAAAAPLLLLHDPNSAEQSLYPANSLTAFFPSLSSSSSASPYFSQNPALGYGGGVAQFNEHVVGALPIPVAQQQQPHHHQIPSQGFSLSLSSSSSPRPPPPRPHLPGRPAPLGPFTGYAAVLNRSRFVDPARRLLEEVCGDCHAGHQAATAAGGRDMLLDVDPRRDSLADDGDDSFADHGMKEDSPIYSQQWKKSRLLSMLDEVYRRYKQYYQQVQAVITSFESVAGLCTAAPYASMALKAMAKHFRCLKNIISDQLHQANKALGNEGAGRSEISNLGLLENSGYLQRTTATATTAGTFAPPHAWRPQRGLPERAVSVLRSWLFEHFLHPYPTDVDKQNLAKQTGLTRNQVSNWFINARVRLWKPMVEEIHSLEVRQKNKTSAAVATDNHRIRHSEEQTQPPPSSKMNPFDHHTMLQIMNTQGSSQFSAAKGVSPGELTPMPSHFQAPGGFDMRSHLGSGSGVVNGVSLTLGLHQNNGVCFPEPVVPLNVARRFGLEECSDGYLVNAFGEQERGSRLLHDFVG